MAHTGACQARVSIGRMAQIDPTAPYHTDRKHATRNMHQVRAELNTRGVAGVENHVTRRLRESAVAYGGKDCHIGVREVDFRNAIREAGVPLTESDTRRIFEHFEVRTASRTLPKNWI